MTNIISLKKNKLRYNEYYEMQDIFDTLYTKSREGKSFNKLLNLITLDENIKLAYRNIKNNKGSTTKGSDEETIEDINKMSSKELIDMVKNSLENYKPGKVRRVEIPKPNGKMRPLGIPNIKDRIIQQCIKQILEPICEAKFHPHSYGFRPNRSTEHAIGRMLFLNNIKNMHYVVDIDIKGFFDNVSHEKLMKQLWTLGIRDKNLLCVIGKILRAEIDGIGVPSKGTPQGGVLSPLLSNIVLNELDWWLSNQYETATFCKKDSKEPVGERWASMIRVNNKMKKFFFVRYADDFKIVCKNYKDAKKICEATKSWLNERLKLEVSEDKTKITNLKRNYSEFLGFKFKLWEKSGKHVIKSHVSEKAKKNIINKVKKNIMEMKKHPTGVVARKYNACVLGIHGYYSIATNVSADFREIGFSINRTLYNRLRLLMSRKGTRSKAFEKYYKTYSNQLVNIGDVALFPITGIKNKIPMCFAQDICDYTKSGRLKIHAKLNKLNPNELSYFMENMNEELSTQKQDNAISLYVAQNGKCGITGESIGNNYVIYNKKKTEDLDKYSNLIIIKKRIEMLIKEKDTKIVNEAIIKEKFNDKQISKINKLRKYIGNVAI
ncbi:reverse transcriptase [Clostridium sp. NCR]|nr:reverse transcriptase [Clostridium sp. NCR]